MVVMSHFILVVLEPVFCTTIEATNSISGKFETWLALHFVTFKMVAVDSLRGLNLCRSNG